MTFPSRIEELAVRIATEIKLLRENPPGAALQAGKADVPINRADRWVGVNVLGNPENGQGLTPDTPWTLISDLIPAGRTLSSVHLAGYVTGTQVNRIDGLEVHLGVLRPTSPGLWLSGFDQDSQVTGATIVQGLWQGGAGDLEQHAGMVVHPAYTLAEAGYLALHVRPLNRSRNGTVFHCSWAFEFG